MWKVLSPLNTIAAECPLDDHKFLTEDRLAQQTRPGDLMTTVTYDQPAALGEIVLPPYAFVVESPTFVAFCATRYNGLNYASSALFTIRSLDGQTLRESDRVRIYHGFGDTRVRLGDRQFEVGREAVVSMK